MNNKDQMPERGTTEFTAYAERLMKLSVEDFYVLFGMVGITFASRHHQDQPATLEELKEIPRDTIVDIFDEADSKAKVDHFLEEKGV